MITDRVPYPMIGGAALRVSNVLRRIAKEHEVWLAALIANPEEAQGVVYLRDLCKGIETAHVEPAGALARPIDGLRYLLTGKPPDLRFGDSKELIGKIRRLVTKVNFDIVHIEFGHMGLYLEALPQQMRARAVWMLHDIDWSKYAGITRLEVKRTRRLRAWLHGRMMRWWKPRYAERFERCITVSESDRRLMLAANPRLRVEVVPNGVDTHLCQPLPYPNTAPALIFVGNMHYRPNLDAMSYFSREIYPHIQREVVGVEMWIVGQNRPGEESGLDGNSVHVTGRVDDLIPYYRRSTVSVVPLRAGGGTRLKILEAMALGRPVVSTSIGCEGLEVIDGEHLFIADSPEAFAERTVRLLTDEPLRQRMASRARELVTSRYDWDAIAGKLMRIYGEVGEGRGLDGGLAQ